MIEPVRRVLVCASVIGALAAADAPRDVFDLAILRRDGVVIPFAMFDGKRWRNEWPRPAADLVVPISVSSVPKRWWGAAGPRETWQAWTDAGERAIRVTQPDWVNVHCARHIGLRTDYEPSSPAPSGIQQPYPKDGLALSPARPIEAIQTMLPDGAESRTVMSVLREAFNRAERETAGRFGHPIDRRERERIEPRPEAVYMFGESPRFVYVESVRPYLTKDATAGECSTLGFGTGWFIHDTDGVRPLVMAVDLLKCDRVGASYMLPLGVVRAAGRLFWVAQFSGWEHERYVVIELKSKDITVAVNAWGGGC